MSSQLLQIFVCPTCVSPVCAGTAAATYFDVIFWRAATMDPQAFKELTCQLTMMYPNWAGRHERSNGVHDARVC